MKKGYTMNIMKKKICVLLTGVMIACTLIACGKEKETEVVEEEINVVQEDLVEFINEELPAIAADKNNAMAIYNSYFTGVDIDNEALVADLKANVLPSMETYITNLSAIQVDTSEVEEIKQLYLVGIQKQYEAMKMVVNAVENQMPDYLVQAEALIVEAEIYMTDYEAKVVEVANNNQITIKSETVSSGDMGGNAVDNTSTEETVTE